MKLNYHFLQIIFILTSSLSTTVLFANKIDAVIVTTTKDIRAFLKSINSAMRHLVDVDKFYIICPNVEELKSSIGSGLNERMIIMDESKFPFDGKSVATVMIDAVRWKGLYPLDEGKSPFERTIFGRIGWFLQQLLKFYAGRVIGLTDYVLLDSDVVWFKDVRFVNSSSSDGKNLIFNYASSCQYHPSYMATLSAISGVGLLQSKGPFRSGIVHHITMKGEVLNSLINMSEEKHGGLPFWQILLNVSALEMTCRAPRSSICGGASTLSEYELYFNFARSLFPHTVNLRPLLWANGPSPGLLYWPDSCPPKKFCSDGHKSSWIGHRQHDIPKAFERQILADQLQGYDFIGYHAYAKRRYFEIVHDDAVALCGSAPRAYFNSTCSWRGFHPHDATMSSQSDSAVSEADWFANCACELMMNP